MTSTFDNKYTGIIQKLTPDLDKLNAELTPIYKQIGDKTAEVIKLSGEAYRDIKDADIYELEKVTNHNELINAITREITELVNKSGRIAYEKYKLETQIREARDANYIEQCKSKGDFYKCQHRWYTHENTIVNGKPLTPEDVQYGIKLLRADIKAKNRPIVAAIKKANRAIIARNDTYREELRCWFRKTCPDFKYVNRRQRTNQPGHIKWDRIPRSVFDEAFASSEFSGEDAKLKYTIQNPVIVWILSKPIKLRTVYPLSV